VFMVDSVRMKGSESSLDLPPLSTSTTNISNYLTTDFYSTSGKTYSALCHRPSVEYADEEPTCFMVQQPSHKTFTHTLAFKSGMRKDWVGALTGESNLHTQPPKVFTDENGIRFEVDSGKPPADALPIGQMKNGKWVAYAARALVIRFWDLAMVRLLIPSIFTILNVSPSTESRLPRYSPHLSRLHPNAHNLLPSPSSFPKPRFIILAPISHPLLSGPRPPPLLTYCYGVENPNRSCCLDRGFTIPGLYGWVW
jgi:hypothetical protein